jgi:endonuclease/exonuclease/phosphatase family metal-dependent hydrolase
MKFIRSTLSLSIILWNVWLLPSPISIRPGTRAKLISPLLANHDVVILNEAFTYKKAIRKEAGYDYIATLDERSFWPWNFRPLDSGLMILSKYPFDRIAKETFRSKAGDDSLTCKGVIMVRITVDGAEVDIYATHMQSQPSAKRHRQRMNQVEQLAKFINTHSGHGSDRHVIVAGDMNMGPLSNTSSSAYDWAYENQNDKELRTAAYTKLKELTVLEDAEYESPYWQQDINRFMVRNVEGIVKNIGKPIAKIRGDDLDLSDSERYEFLAVVNR